jgi:aspartyl-tRNA(Asn)/glutamyl-tRNA(Gln) amidotransferase subunit B
MNEAKRFSLELKLQLNTSSKLFCACSSNYQDAPNSHVCPICLAYPGALPVPNEHAVKQAVVLSQALNATLPPGSIFERRLDYSPLFPRGYQIGQYRKPLAEKGYFDSNQGKVIIESIILEEDAALKAFTGQSGRPQEYIDYNRSGIALVRLVTEEFFCIEEHVQDVISRFLNITESLELALPLIRQSAFRYRLLDTSQKLLSCRQVYLPEPDLGELRLNYFRILPNVSK